MPDESFTEPRIDPAEELQHCQQLGIADTPTGRRFVRYGVGFVGTVRGWASVACEGRADLELYCRVVDRRDHGVGHATLTVMTVCGPRAVYLRSRQ